MTAADAAKVADWAPDGTETLAGTVRFPLFDASATELPAAPAALSSATVQVEFAPAATVAGVQLRDASCAGATIVNTTDLDAPNVAAMVAC